MWKKILNFLLRIQLISFHFIFYLEDLSFGQKSVCSLSAGFIASIIANPADLVLIRMQNDTTLKFDERRNYKNVFDAFSRIIKEEGVPALWRGCGPTIVRAMATNFGFN